MSTGRTDLIFPGEVRQVGHVVADLDAAMAEWLALGVGPWTAIEVTQSGARFHGQASDPTTAIGFANIGPMQIELIEAKGDAHSIWHEARDLGRFGPHHIAYWADDFDRTIEMIEQAGLVIAQDGDGRGMARFVYVETSSGSIIEIMELTDLCRAFMDGIRLSSERWDGSNPIR